MPYVTTISHFQDQTTDINQTMLHLYGLAPPPVTLDHTHARTFHHFHTRWFGEEFTPPVALISFNTAINRLLYEINKFKITYPDQQIWYHTFQIPKASGGMRRIDAPIDELKELQREIVRTFTMCQGTPMALPHDCAYAYIANRSAREALIQHQQNNSNWFLKLDIRDFFPSCKMENTINLLQLVYPFSQLSPTILGQILEVCMWNGSLPQGAVTSPMLTNMLMVHIDKHINDVFYNWNNHRFIYTRYADDMLISARESFNWQEAQQLVADVLRPFFFELKQEKTRYGSKAGRNWNLGLMLNKDNNITLGHEEKARIKAMLWNFLKDFEQQKPWTVAQTQQLIGQLSYLGGIEPQYKSKLINRYERKLHCSYRAIIKHILRHGD